jgi:hypothetical protein
VQLDQVEAALVDGCVHHFQGLIDEQADGLHKGGQMADDGGGLFGEHVPGRFGMEDEPQGIGSGGNSRQGILKVGYAADLDFYHICFATEPQSHREKPKKE